MAKLCGETCMPLVTMSVLFVKYSFTFKKTTCCFEFMEAWTQVKGRFGSLGCGSWG